MAGPSAQEIQEQMRRSQQLIGLDAAAQQSVHSMAPGGNYAQSYAPFVPPVPFQAGGVQNNVRARGIPVSMGKLSLLSISFSLMLLGAFTFLGGFLLGIWVAGPRVSQPIGGYIPQQQNMPSYPTYPQGGGMQQGANFENMGRQMGSAAEAAIKDKEIEGVPKVLSPFLRAAQAEIGKRVGERTEELVKQQTWVSPPAVQQQYSPPAVQQQYSPPAVQQQYSPPAAQQQYSPPAVQRPSSVPPMEHSPPSSGPAQLPVVTPQSGPTPISFTPVSQENDGSYTIQLGVYASYENANALVNHMQALSYPSQITEGKAPDGSKIYYVHSGAYKDYTTALAAASQFVSQNIPGAIIVKISQQHKNTL